MTVLVVLWEYYDLSGGVSGSMGHLKTRVAVLVVLWTDPRLVWRWWWFYGQTRGLCGGCGGSMDRPEASVAV